MPDRLKSTAFTLIELLVVMAVIALLIGLLLPALNRANEMARSALCASNERVIGVAFHTYYSENDCLAGTWGYWPNTPPDFPKAYPYDCWAEYLSPYLGGAGTTQGCVWQITKGVWDLVTCPTDILRMGLNGPGTGSQPRSEYPWRVSYGINSSLIYPNPYPPGRKHRLPDSRAAAGRVLLMDAGESLMWYGNTKEYLSRTNGHTVWARHSLGMNVLWLDGHVEWRLKKSMTTQDLNPDVTKVIYFTDDADLYN